MWKFLHKNDHGWLKRPSAKGRDGARERNFGFRERSIVSYSSFTYFQKHFSSCSLQACFRACSKVKGLQVFLRHTYLKIRERSAKDRRKVRERSRRPSKPPALQAVGDDIAFAIRCWSLGLGQVPTPLDLPSMLCGLTGAVLELRAWAKSSFRVQGLVFASNMFPRKLAMVCAKGTFHFREEVILL